MQKAKHYLYTWLTCSSDGRIFSEKSKKYLCNKPNHNGYVSLTFYKIGSKQAHRIIAESFFGKIPAGMEVNHINGIKHDNRPCNLEYVTKSENAKHACRIGLKSNARGKNPRAIIKEEDICIIKQRRISGEKYCEIAKNYNVTPETISNICRGKTW